MPLKINAVTHHTNTSPAHSAGDLIVAFGWLTGSITANTGWTQVASLGPTWNYDQLGVAWRIGDGSTVSAFSYVSRSRYFAITGHDPVSPIAAVSSGRASNGSFNAPQATVIPAITVPEATGTSVGSVFFRNTRITLADNVLFQMGTGDFCIECWFFPTRTTIENLFYRGPGISGTTQGWSLDQGKVIYVGGSNITSTNNYNVNSWNHVAVTRSSGTTRLFLNGVLNGTASDTTDYNLSDVLTIGDRYLSHPYANYPFLGYISNFRVVKGSAVYTGAFTPPTSPLTAVSGTSLLTANSSGSTISDSSGNNLTITSTAVATTGNFGVVQQGANPFADTSGGIRLSLITGYGGGGNPPYYDAGAPFAGGPMSKTPIDAYSSFYQGGNGQIATWTYDGYANGNNAWVTLSINPAPSSGFFAMF